jgi:arylsulfatase A-like enzyme
LDTRVLITLGLTVLFSAAGPGVYGADSYNFKTVRPPVIVTRALHDEREPIVRDVVAGDVLYFAYALPTEVYADEKAAYTLSVVAETPAGKSTLIKKILRPAKREEDQRWHPEKLSLEKFAGQKVTLRFKSVRKGVKEPPVPGALWGGVRIGNFTRREGEFNIILISIDTLRWDRLSASGYWRDTSPEIDLLANGGAYFRRAVAQSSWTKPSHMSLFTSLYPSTHRIESQWGQRGVYRRLAQRFPTMTEFLSARGYLTQAFTGSAHVTATVGFDRGFDCFEEYPLDNHVDGKLVFGNGKDWIQKHADEKFFLFLHTYEVHVPRRHSNFVKPGMDGLERINAAYDSGVRFVSRLIGDLTAMLDDLKLRENTLIIIFSDHGESLGEHRIRGHAKSLYDEVVLVPLIFNRPGTIAPRKIEDFKAQLVDVFPTVVDLLGAPPQPGLIGRSLKPILMGEALPSESLGVSELTWYVPGIDTRKNRKPGVLSATTEEDNFELKRRLVSLRYQGDGYYKMIYNARFADGSDKGRNLASRDKAWKTSLREGGKEMFDLKKDPDEITNIANRFPSLFDRLLKRLQEEMSRGPAHFDQSEEKDDKAFDPSIADQLRSLGY